MNQLIVDLDEGKVRVVQDARAVQEFGLSSPEAFGLIARVWLRAGWDTKYVYSFTWLGRPIIQLPEDMVRMQEMIYTVKPDVIIETGVAHGGSLVYYASLCRAMDRGRVIGIDIEIRPPNRRAIEAHPLFDRITLVDGSSIDPAVVSRVCSVVAPGETVLVVLDSCHTKAHVLAELEAYGPLVRPGSYIVVTDGIMADLVGAPRSQSDWSWNNPQAAVRAFLPQHPEFVLEEPAFLFNEGTISERVTYWPSAFLRKI